MVSRCLKFFALTACVTAASVVSGCDRTNTSPITELTATGTIQGRVYEDVNGNGLQDGSDPGIGPVIVRAAYRGTTTPVAQDTTGVGQQGTYQMEVPVGTYWVTLDSLILGDSFQIIRPDTIAHQVLPGLNTNTSIGLSFRRFNIEDVRQLPAGQKVSVLAFALNNRATFGDSTVFISDGSWAIRATNMARSNVRQGDSIRISGTTARDLGQPVLDLVTATVLTNTGTPQAPLLSTAQAATASGGRQDANHVRVRNARVTDTVSVDLDFQATVDDGSGPLTVYLDRDALANTTLFQPQSVFSELRGVLLPSGTGSWILLPRGGNDVIP